MASRVIPLTGATQIPSGSQIDALHGSLQIVASLGHGKTEHQVQGAAQAPVAGGRRGRRDGGAGQPRGRCVSL